MALYNLTGIGNMTGMVDLLGHVNNDLTLKAFGMALLLVISIIVLIASYGATGDPGKATVAAAFISIPISLLFLAMGIINPLAPWICFVMFGIAAAFTH